MLDMQGVGPDLSNPAGLDASDDPDEVVLVPHLDGGVIHERVHELGLVGVAHGEHLDLVGRGGLEPPTDGL
jgi:hypothetical protein